MGKLQFHQARGLAGWKKTRRKHGSAFSREKTKMFCKVKLMQFERERAKRFAGSSSEEEHKVNALASGADEGRD